MVAIEGSDVHGFGVKIDAAVGAVLTCVESRRRSRCADVRALDMAGTLLRVESAQRDGSVENQVAAPDTAQRCCIVVGMPSCDVDLLRSGAASTPESAREQKCVEHRGRSS